MALKRGRVRAGTSNQAKVDAGSGECEREHSGIILSKPSERLAGRELTVELVAGPELAFERVAGPETRLGAEHQRQPHVLLPVWADGAERQALKPRNLIPVLSLNRNHPISYPFCPLKQSNMSNMLKLSEHSNSCKPLRLGGEMDVVGGCRLTPG